MPRRGRAGRAGRARGADAARAGRRGDRAHRAPRSRCWARSSVRCSRRRAGRRARALPDGPSARRSVPDEGRRRDPGRPAAVHGQPRAARRRLPGPARHLSGRALPARRAGDRRQEQHPRVRPAVDDAAAGLRPDPQSLGPRALAERLFGRRVRRGGGGARPDRARERRRRLDPAAGGLVRSGGPQALARPRRARAHLDRALVRGLRGDPQRARRGACCSTRCTATRPGDLFVLAEPSAAVSPRSRRRSGPPADRPAHPHARRARPPRVPRRAPRRRRKTLETLGHSVEEAWPEALFDEERALRMLAFGPLEYRMCLRTLARLLGRRGRARRRRALLWTLAGLDWPPVTAEDYLDAAEWRQGWATRVAAWWAGGFDLLVTPTVCEPPALLERAGGGRAAPVGPARASRARTWPSPSPST